jgi:hypothetical protein
VHAGFIDTDMAAPATNVPKDSPESVAQQTFDDVEAGRVEMLADARTGTVKAQLLRHQELIDPAHPRVLGRRSQGWQLAPSAAFEHPSIWRRQFGETADSATGNLGGLRRDCTAIVGTNDA